MPRHRLGREGRRALREHGAAEQETQRDDAVVERVDGTGGRVKIGGEIWSARAFQDDAVIEAGKQVDVVQIEGATALVYE